MKKLMFAIAAVAAGAVFAEEAPAVTSANVVGYNGLTFVQGSTAATLFDFLDVGGAEGHTLAEITPVSVDGTEFNNQNFMIIPVGLYGGGSPDLLLDNEWLAADETLNNIPGFSEFIEENADADTGFCYYEGGWYLTRDFEHKYECSHYPVPAAEGWVVMVGGTQRNGVQLTLPHAFK